jgi:PPK2 family polyphosphate:nucleotide phosphotransferase
MLDPVVSPYRVPFDGSFRVAEAPTDSPKDAPKKKALKESLGEVVDELDDLQRELYAQDQYSLLLVFQAMDAAGKDSTMRAVTRGINPAGCQVFSFKKPSAEELDHDFLWRTTCRLPERGRIGIFNRSYYESVLVVRVHPKILDGAQLPPSVDRERIWEHRYESIREQERHLARNGTVVLKFWLNVSYEEQRRRFLARIEEPDKNWKFSEHDVKERKKWPRYMEAYEAALNATSRPWAPWFAIPADDKPFMRYTVARIVADTLKGMGVAYPTVSDERRAELQRLKTELEQD